MFDIHQLQHMSSPVLRCSTEWPDAPGIWSEEQVIGWRDITDAVHEKGGRIYAQLWHGKVPSFVVIKRSTD